MTNIGDIALSYCEKEVSLKKSPKATPHPPKKIENLKTPFYLDKNKIGKTITNSTKMYVVELVIMRIIVRIITKLQV